MHISLVVNQTKLFMEPDVKRLVFILTFPSAHPSTIGPADGQAIQVTALVCMNLLQIT